MLNDDDPVLIDVAPDASFGLLEGGFNPVAATPEVTAARSEEFRSAADAGYGNCFDINVGADGRVEELHAFFMP